MTSRETSSMARVEEELDELKGIMVKNIGEIDLRDIHFMIFIYILSIDFIILLNNHRGTYDNLDTCLTNLFWIKMITWIKM